jgi:AbiV family abortive infection protein
MSRYGATLLTVLTHGYLCMGTFLAAEQAWHLLNDANILYSQNRYANSLVLSVYSVEETGRSRIYLEQTEQVLRGETVTLEETKERCKVHMVKLQQGRSPLTIHASSSSAGIPPAPGSSEAAEVFLQLHKTRQKREEAAPRETHQKRFEALYVDPIDGVRNWNTPAATQESDAWDMLYVAGIEYQGHYIKLNNLLANRDEFKEIKSRVQLPHLPEMITLPGW